MTLPLLILSGHVSPEKMMLIGPSCPHTILYWTGIPQVFFHFIEIRFFSHTLRLNYSVLSFYLFQFLSISSPIQNHSISHLQKTDF